MLTPDKNIDVRRPDTIQLRMIPFPRHAPFPFDSLCPRLVHWLD